MKRGTCKRAVLLLITAMLLFVAMANLAFADDALTPGMDDAAESSGDSNFIEYRDNYILDTEKISFFKNPMSTTFDGAANGLFTLQKGLATIQIYLFQIALEANIQDLLEQFITPFIDSMRTIIFEGFSVFFISLCALLLLIKLAANRQAQAISGLLQILLVVTLAFVFYNHPVEMMQMAGDVTNEVSDAVLEGPYSAINGSGTSTSMEGKVAALVWNVMVHKPWQTAEFGSIETAETYEDDILKYAPESDERKELVKKLAEEEGLFSKSLSHQLERIFTLLVLGTLNLLIFLFLTAFCVLIVGYQFLTLGYMMLGVFVFMLALIPYFGTEIVKRWALRIAAACGTKILLAFILSLLLVFMDAMYSFIDTEGLLYTLFMIIVIIGMIYTKRKEILGLFTDFRANNMSVAGTYQTMHRALDQDLNMVHNLNNLYSMKKQERQDPGLYSGDTSQRDRGRSSYRQSGNYDYHSDSSGYDQRPSLGTGSRYSMDVARNDMDPKDYMQRARSDEFKATAQDMSRYFKRAEEMLQKYYEKSKTESEETAERKGKGPEYGDFVRRTNAVRSLGAGQFDQRDVSALARMMANVERKGGNLESVHVGGKNISSAAARRPANLFDRSAISGEADPGAGSASVPAAQKRVKLGIEYFRDNFGEEKGEEFFDAMSRKYDSFTVAGFGSAEKLSYAQVQRQLKEKEKVYQTQKKAAAHGENGQAINMRDIASNRAEETGEDHGR